jgi:hypothetical protein
MIWIGLTSLILQEEYLIKCSLILFKLHGRINNMCHKAIWPRNTTLYSEMGEKIDREISYVS